jgi:hypothetical protein
MLGPRRRRAVSLLGVVAVLVTTVPAEPAPGAAASAPRACAPSWHRVPAPDPGSSFLLDVGAISATDAWAVGGSESGRTLVEHWDGDSWSIVPTPDTSNPVNYLTSVAATSSTDVWAVGAVGREGSYLRRSLIEHWDGTTWSIVLSPSPHEDQVLTAVDAVSSSDAWAVGFSSDDDRTNQAFVLHWDGASWDVVPAVEPGENSSLWAVAALSGSDVWAVGRVSIHGVPGKTLTEHWDGVRWSVVHSPNPAHGGNEVLSAAVAFGPDDVWTGDTGSITHTLVEHWDGISWSIVRSPSPRTYDRLTDLDGRAASDIWAVGNSSNVNSVQALVLHYDGREWTVARAPSPGRYGQLEGVAVAPGGDGWAVGSIDGSLLVEAICPLHVTDHGFEPSSAVTANGPVAFAVDAADTSGHRIVDATGLGLFDSGPRPPGSSFVADLFACGTFTVADAATGRTASVGVPDRVDPATGIAGSRFQVVYAERPAPPGYVYDVQVERPGSPGFVDEGVGQKTRRRFFQADAGPGTYRFRSRIRSLGFGATSGYSPPVAILVEQGPET